MKKKVIAIALIVVLVVGCIFVLTACSKKSASDVKDYKQFRDISPDETLVVTTSTNTYKFANIYNEQVEDYYIEYPVSQKYVLSRSSSRQTGSVEYNNYYYKWNAIDVATERYYVGNRTIKTYLKYSYLIYTQNETIAIKTTAITETKCSYQNQWIERDVNYTTDLSGYFNSMTELREQCAELYNMINLTGKYKKYIDATIPTEYHYTSQTYNGYYYFEA